MRFKISQHSSTQAYSVQVAPQGRQVVQGNSWIEDLIRALSPADQAYARKTGKIPCPDCLDWVKQSALRRHYQDHRFQEMRRNSVIDQDWRGCLLCADVFIGEKELEAHHLEIHRAVWPTEQCLRGRLMLPHTNRAKAPAEPRMRTWRVIEKIDPAAELVRAKEPRQRESMDATVRYAHAFRNRGYGSHPAHDDFGDESKS